MKLFICLPLLFIMLLNNCPGQGKNYQPPFFVFNNGIRDEQHDTPEKQVALLKSLGYNGMEKEGLDDVDALQNELEKQGMKLFTIYLNVNLDPGKLNYDERLPQVLKKLKGKGTMLWLNITSQDGVYPSSSHAGDTAAIRIIRQLAGLADNAGVKLMLYPHTWLWLERFDLGLELVKKINRKNVGIAFNLPHYLAQAQAGEENQIPALLKMAGKQLFAVSICGATVGKSKEQATVWDSLIQPLGAGTFDNTIILKTLKEMKFEGPVGLQCYNIKGDRQDILSRSMLAWTGIIQRINQQK